MTTKKQIEEGVKKTVDYLYSLDESCPPELRQAIATLRQLTNEEFVHKNKAVSSQLIWDILKQPSLDLIAKARIEELQKLKRGLPTKFSPDGAGGWHVRTYKLAIEDIRHDIDSRIKELQ